MPDVLRTPDLPEDFPAFPFGVEGKRDELQEEIMTITTVEPSGPSRVSRPKKRAGRKTDAERAHGQELERKRARYAAQEAKRAPAVQIDQKATLYLLEVLVAISFVSSGILLANATVDVANRMGLGFNWMSWLAFGAIEVAILIFMLGYLIVGSRIDDETGLVQDSRIWFRLMVAYSGITILSSAYHTMSFWLFDWANPDMWAGAVLAVVVPLSYVLAVKVLSVVVFARAVRL